MELLGIDKLRAFWKYYNDFELMYDHRYVDKEKIFKEINEEEIRVLTILEYNYFLINAKTDSKQLVARYKETIDQHKNKVTSEVLEYLQKGEKPEVTKPVKTWFNRIFKR